MSAVTTGRFFIASSVAVIDHGSIVFTGSLQQLRASPELASRYLVV